MAGYKSPDFNERAAAARAAKQKALDQLRDMPAPDPATLAEQQAAREARDAAAAERRAERQRALEEEKAAKLAEKLAEKQRIADEKEAAEAAKAPPRTEAELKAARDARYAARKARKR